MKNIDSLEHGGGHAMVRRDGALISLPDPTTQHYQWVLLALGLGHVPGTPTGIPEWQRRLVFERWRVAWDLPDFKNAQRLAYLVDNYRAAISHDLIVQANLDLGELWRARRWTLLLDVIDRLPSHSWYGASVAMDEEHARMMAESMAARQAANPEAAEDKGPPLTTWTPEVARLTDIFDAVQGVRHAVYAAQHGKKAGEPPKAAQRPVTPLERALKLAQHERRKAAHEALAARVLGRKPPVKE